MQFENLIKTKYELVQESMEAIHYEHRYDAGAMFGTLTAREAESTYRRLIAVIPKIPDLTKEEKEKLKAEIEAKIAAIPEVEEEKNAEYHEYEETKKRAFEAAKARFAALSVFEQFSLRQQKLDPENVDIEWKSIPEIEAMYTKKR